MLLENKNIVVTGGGRGIGRSIAILFAKEGAKAAIIARTLSQLTSVADEIKNLGYECFVQSADISNEKEVEDSFSKIKNKLGSIDVLVNNAGIELKKPFIDMSLSEWDQTMNVNARGVVLCTKAALPDMLKKSSGSIINISSGAGIRGLPGSSAYSASKAAVIALSYALADEVRDKGVRVNVICPGLIKTDMLDKKHLSTDNVNILEPKDVAGTALFLASNLSGKISGQVFSVRNSNRW